MKKTMLAISLCAVTFCTTFPGVCLADETGNNELKKIAHSIVNPETMETVMNVVVSGDGLKDKPNMPRTGEITVAVDSSAAKKTKERKLSLNINTFKGRLLLSLTSIGEVLYLNLNSPGSEEIAYFYDPTEAAAKKKNPMLAGVLGKAQTASSLDNDAKLTQAVLELSKKGEISVIIPGHLSIKSKAKPDNVFNLFYSKTTFLPRRMEFFQAEKKIKIVVNFAQWTTSGPVDTKLPQPENSYTLFGMEHLAGIVAALPKSKEILSPKAHKTSTTGSVGLLSGVNNMDTPRGAPNQLEAANGIGIIPPLAKTTHDLLVKEVRESAKEMRKVIDTLSSPDFKNTLENLDIRLKKIEGQLKMLDNHNSGKH